MRVVRIEELKEFKSIVKFGTMQDLVAEKTVKLLAMELVSKYEYKILVKELTLIMGDIFRCYKEHMYEKNKIMLVSARNKNIIDITYNKFIYVENGIYEQLHFLMDISSCKSCYTCSPIYLGEWYSK